MQNLAPISLAFCGQHRASGTGTPSLEEGWSTWKGTDGGEGQVENASH